MFLVLVLVSVFGECRELLNCRSFSKVQVGRNREVYKQASHVCQIC